MNQELRNDVITALLAADMDKRDNEDETEQRRLQANNEDVTNDIDDEEES